MSANPVIPGFHPDPSVCRVGDEYYLATSSFEYAPGVPIFRSRDMVAWEQIGNALDRPAQLNVAPGLAGANAGIYAPTLRYHDGVFWLITTNVTDFLKGHLIVRATDPAGPWSDPVHTEGALGIDPDLAWDESGICHLTWSAVLSRHIAQAVVDPYTGKLLSKPRELWKGTGLAHPEGPHVFARDGRWYLVVAEGGTGAGHGVSIARSRSIDGPYESHPANPVFTHRSLPDPVQNVGHADLVELADGRWAMVHLGVRPRGTFPKWHVNGRETFLAGIEWADGWPIVQEDAFAVPPAPTSFSDEFADGPALHPRWIAPGVDPRTFVRPREAGGITLLPGRDPAAREAERLLAVRARDDAWQASATVPAGDAALVVRVDDAHWAAVERRGAVLSVRVVVGPLDQILARAEGVPAEHPVAIRAVPEQPGGKGPDRLELGWDDGEFHAIADIDGRYLSTEVAGGFTGRVIGVEALGGTADLTRFTYSAATCAD